MILELSPLNNRLDKFWQQRLAIAYLYIGFGKESHTIYERKLLSYVSHFYFNGIREFLIPSTSKNLWESLNKINQKFPDVKFTKTKRIPLKVLKELSREFSFTGELDEIL